jgi:hypothetical protein
MVSAALAANLPGLLPAKAITAMETATLAVAASSRLDARAIIAAFELALRTPGLDPSAHAAIREARNVFLESLRNKKNAGDFGHGGEAYPDFGAPPIGGGTSGYRDY